MLKIGYDYRSFTLLNFIGAAILNFMTRYGCRYCYSLEVLLCETIEQPFTRHEIQDGGAREI